ncbi:hypothetical protein [Bacillus halotolerans]|uniref:hypothetical protein n=1 Tax=Bacillus halotolerans TaxID=260554 RepID=UPI001D0D951E|nr:hypothetical protein [Bacillus halotolerans]MCC2114986.1 hypothetical protein [Bacillus halotolerans]MDG3073695.1 hypothetical protein [Bacillus halotolerans]
MYAGEIVKQKETELWFPYRAGTFIGEVRILEGSWYIVNEKKKEARLLFSKTATNKMIGDIIKILSC